MARARESPLPKVRISINHIQTERTHAMEKILRINVSGKSSPESKTESIGDYAGLGGRGLTSAIVSTEVPPLCHPLGEDNKLVIAPGLLRIDLRKAALKNIR